MLFQTLVNEELSRLERIQAVRDSFKEKNYNVYKSVYNNLLPRKPLTRFNQQPAIQANTLYKAYKDFVDHLHNALGGMEKLKKLQTADLETFISPELDCAYVDLLYYNNVFKYFIVGPNAPYTDKELRNEKVRDELEAKIVKSANNTSL